MNAAGAQRSLRAHRARALTVHGSIGDQRSRDTAWTYDSISLIREVEIPSIWGPVTVVPRARLH